MKLSEISGTYSVVRFDSGTTIPSWVLDSQFYSISKTDEELSIVCDSTVVPGADLEREDYWKCLKVEGPLDFALTGILSSIAAPLAADKISIFATSTFDTDYVMVKEKFLSHAKESLRNAGFEVL